MNSEKTDNTGDEKIDVSYVAQLARISLSDDEKVLFQDQLEHILEHVAKLDELDVSDVEPMAHATPIENQFREDTLSECIDHDAVMKNAPEVRQDLIFVPKIIE